jgi:hypothetical protein
MSDKSAPETPRTVLHAYLETADPIVAETAIALLDVELAEVREAGSTDALRAALETIDGELRHYDLSDDPGYIRVPTERVRAIFALAASDAGPAESMPVTLVGMALHAIKQRDRLHETPCRCEADAFDLRQWHESEALPDDRHSVMGLSRESDR